MSKWIFTALCVGFCLAANAQPYITYDEISLLVADEPGRPRTLIYPEENRMAVERRPVTKYYVELNSGKKAELSERRYLILAVLFKARTGFASALELNQLLAEESAMSQTLGGIAAKIAVDDWAAEVDGLNRQVESVLGRPLLLIQKGPDGPRFKIASQQLDAYGVDSVFAMHEDGKHVTYRGRAIELTPRQMQIVSVLANQPDKSMSHADMRTALGLSEGSNRHLDNAALINAASFVRTGAPLLIAQKGALRLDLQPLPEFAKGTRIVKVRGKEMEIGPMQQRAFDVLGLDRVPLNWDIVITREQFVSSGLNPAEMRSALRALNHKFQDAFGEPLISSAHDDFMTREGFSIKWTGSDFKRPYESSGDCSSRLHHRRTRGTLSIM